MAEAEPRWNYLGVEIRHPLVDEANRIAGEEGLTNLRYEFCNAMLWLRRLIEDIPDGILQAVTIQFPDPWFKKKHAKRRMVNAELVAAVVDKLAGGGRVFVQTDIESLAEEMFELFRGDSRLEEKAVAENPFPVKTERERAVEDKELPVYRKIFVRNSETTMSTDWNAGVSPAGAGPKNSCVLRSLSQAGRLRSSRAAVAARIITSNSSLS
jgi:tRNA (guanine-N7-)-methyltransferase